MALNGIRYRVREEAFEVVGRGRFEPSDDDLIVLPLELVRDASATDLRNAFRRREERWRAQRRDLHEHAVGRLRPRSRHPRRARADAATASRPPAFS